MAEEEKQPAVAEEKPGVAEEEKPAGVFVVRGDKGRGHAEARSKDGGGSW